MKQIILVLAMLVAWAFPMNREAAGGGLRAVVSDHLNALFEAVPERPGAANELVIWPAGCPLDGVIEVIVPGPDGEDV